MAGYIVVPTGGTPQSRQANPMISTSVRNPGMIAVSGTAAMFVLRHLPICRMAVTTATPALPGEPTLSVPGLGVGQAMRVIRWMSIPSMLSSTPAMASRTWSEARWMSRSSSLRHNSTK